MSRRALPVALAAGASLALACGAGGGNGSLDASCDPGWHACGTGCAPDASPQSCGTLCTPCPGPGHGTATCVSGACGIACDAGYHACGASCADDASPDSCGTSCTPCPPPAVAHARAACVAGACDHICDDGYARCAAGCCGAPVAGLARLAAGEAHTCGITAAGEVKCWGLNASGQVGDGSGVPNRLSPVPVAGSGSLTPLQVAAAFRHSCGIAQGNAYCWGDNWALQVAPASGNHGSPVPVPGISDVRWMAGGWAHTCALLGTGRVACWGNGEVGQIGNGSADPNAVAVPTPVSDLDGAFALLAGYRFSCALTDLTTMRCWGHNGSGQLGDPAAGTMATTPIPVANLGDVAAIRAVALGQEHVCVAYDKPGASGRVRCWGRGDAGQLGNGATPAAQKEPVEVLAGSSPLEGVSALAAGWAHTCALTEAGGVKCWGSNAQGQLGDGTGTGRSTAVDVVGLAGGVAGIAAGFHHTCALAGSSPPTLACWGSNDQGQLGDGTQASKLSPVTIAGF